MISSMNNSATSYTAVMGGTVRRIRTPNEGDVLSGRGGGINGHTGNVRFREWVRTRKNDYNLASNKVDKARVAQEVIALVRQQNPPGRFLQKDASSGGNWWVELDEDRVIAKTSQALREGAPQIRAAHQHPSAVEPNLVPNQRKRKAARPSVPNKAVFASVLPSAPKRSRPNEDSEYAYQERAMHELRNVDDIRIRNDKLENDPVIRGALLNRTVRIDGVAPTKYFPAPSPIVSPPVSPPLPPKQVSRADSFGLGSEFSLEGGLLDDEFVNPFEDETELINSFDNASKRSTSGNSSNYNPPLPGLYRETSLTSNGDMGGLQHLYENEDTVTAMKHRNSFKFDLDESDPLFTYLASLDTVPAQ